MITAIEIENFKEARRAERKHLSPGARKFADSHHRQPCRTGCAG